MYNGEIDKFCKLNVKGFDGVYSRDELPRNADIFVLNLDPSGPGSHWVCMYNGKYFDSYGVTPPKIIEDRMPYEANTFQLQKNEDICGQYCCYMLYELSRGKDFLSLLLDLY